MLYMNLPEELFCKIFQAKLGEVIDRYRPDLIWFDGGPDVAVPRAGHGRV
jgi:hypothetical protein